MDKEIGRYYEAVLRLTKIAGKLILDKVHTKKHFEVKSGNIDFVTETDKQVEDLLIVGLSKEFPNHKFIGEETVSAGGQCELTDAPTWIIDPIDGTTNFIHSFPHSCISIALFIGGEPKIGIVYNPLLEQLFTAVKSKGAFLNDKPIHVSNVENISDALLMMACGTSRDPEHLRALYKNQQTLIPQVHGIRSLGSIVLNMAMVAVGAADAYFDFGLHIWDIAAAELLVTEAGGVVMDPSGGPLDRCSRRVICASTQSLAKELSQQLTQFHPKPRDG